LCHKGFICWDFIGGHKGIYVLMDGIGVPCQVVGEDLCFDLCGGSFVGRGSGGCDVGLLGECLGYRGERGGVEGGVFGGVGEFGEKEDFEGVRGDVLVGGKQVFVFFGIF